MASRNRVVWSEGLFIKPQHFQQQQRYFEYYVDERVRAVSRYLYGVSGLVLNPEYLSFGSIALESATGIMPDGTVFNVPLEDTLPDPLEITDDSFANQIVYLALPLRSDAITEVSWPEHRASGRYRVNQAQVHDVHSKNGASAMLDVSPVQLKLMLEKEDRSAYSSIAIAKILEKRPDGSLLLDDNFIPCHLAISAVNRTQRFIGEVASLMRERAKNIAQRLGAPNQGGVADVSDFMLLQSLNRMQPQLHHMGNLGRLHPERAYEALSMMSGELATFTDESRMAPEFPNYNHDLPTDCFTMVMRQLRQSLSIVLEPKAVSLQLQKRKYGLMVAPLQDRQLVDDAEFIVAVKARMPLDELRRLFIQQTKVASVEKIRDLIALQLPGVPLTPLPVAPRQLPYHAGYTYYQLDKTSQAWQMLNNASGFAFHVAGDFSELELQFWAIRS
ncbi:type VI secretion system baseplate subunit TssK [Celerinatantimonas yamalensis]|uniref:Type VI secretion system baseplate subunit TssK n=1 Tax=Celerinatantimonas yamalensis TaxID=559956 RepID=A0ABW9G4M9_9GAMM